MKNREKYKNELIKVIKEEGDLCNFMKNHEVFRMIGKDIESYCEIDCVACGTALQIWLDEEFEEPTKPEVDWSKVMVDTLVRVRDNESEEWTLRYFKGLEEEGYINRFQTWVDGATSKTAYGEYEDWPYCELVEDEDNGKKTFDFDK